MGVRPEGGARPRRRAARARAAAVRRAPARGGRGRPDRLRALLLRAGSLPAHLESPHGDGRPTGARSRSTGTPTRRCCGSSGSGSSGARGSTRAAPTRSPSRARSSPARPATSRSSSSATGRAAARVRQRLPPPRLARLRGRGPARDAAVPLPRLDVRPRRLAARRAALRPRARLRQGRARPRAGERSRPGGRSCSSIRTPTRRRSPSTLGELPELVAAAGIDLDSLRFHPARTREYEANWKVCCENFLECYHCQVAHPGFSKVVDVSVDAYELVESRWFSSQYGPVREEPRGTFDPAARSRAASSTSSGRT